MSEPRRALVPILVILALGTALVAGATWYVFYAPRFAIELTVLDASGQPASDLHVTCYRVGAISDRVVSRVQRPDCYRFERIPRGECAIGIWTSETEVEEGD